MEPTHTLQPSASLQALPPPMRALELFCGIGGFAAAVARLNVRLVGALDTSETALNVYRLNFPHHPARQVDLERISAWQLTALKADLWWLSPPCQPYCERGVRRDLADPRAKSLLRLLEILAVIPEDQLPCHLALENVAGFMDSQAHGRLTGLLAERGYQLQERLLCPTQLGVPSRRPRYYLVASRAGLVPPRVFALPPLQPLWNFLNACFFEYGIAAYDLELGKNLATKKRRSSPEFRAKAKVTLKKIRQQMTKDYVIHPILSGPSAVTTLGVYRMVVVPPAAASNLPIRRSTAPVNAPRS